VTVKRRVPREPLVQAMIEEVDGDDSDNEPTDETPRSVRIAQLVADHAAAAACVPPADATVIADPYKAYLRAQATSADPAESGITIAAESSALRAILPVINGQERVEAILDPGCQIVTMSEQVSTALALSYDPTIRLHMVSANGGVDQSLGLAHNVPFLVGTITLYLQVHVLRAPTYDILLGHPFNVLTQSVVRNFSNENQTIAILDPNTGHKATIPTIPRGTFRFAKRNTHKCKIHEQDF
jgi:gag-polyprotein putative aspartyl protease